MASLALTQNSGWLVKLDGGLVLHQDLSPSSPYSTRPRQIYTGHFIKEVRQWEDLLVVRTSNSDLLLARLELLAEEEAWSVLRQRPLSWQCWALISARRGSSGWWGGG